MPPERPERPEQKVRQVIPRPPLARRLDSGRPGGLEGGASAQLTLGDVRAAFAEAADAPAGPPDRAGELQPVASVPPGAAEAAVLILLIPGAGESPVAGSGGSPADVVLIRRATHLRSSPGEIGFPGGRVEPGEEPLAAALREAEEEVGLMLGSVEIVGRLPTAVRLRHADLIWPFVAVAEQRPALTPNSEEVDEILIVPLSELVAPGRYWQEAWDEAGDPAWTMHFFDLGEDLVWGATARMLHVLLSRLLTGEAP